MEFHKCAICGKIVAMVKDGASGNQRKMLKPLEKPEAKFALLPGEKVKAVYEYCNLHGLWRLDMK